MISRAYMPRLMNAYTKDGTVRAITFVINTQHNGYAGRLSIEETTDTIAKAQGRLGRCSEYLENTVMHLDELGIGDGPMHRLLVNVRERMKKLGIESGI